MRQLHEKLNELRRAKGFTYEEVQHKLEERGIHLSHATVGHWFNGTRKPRSMKHLQALCAVLETSLSAVVDDDFTYAESDREQVLLDQFRSMTAEQQSAYLVLGTSMVPNKKHSK
jgi:transcriptional regulator with XRE-family HTH domain